MSADWTIATLIIAGGVLQIAGVLLVVKEVRAARDLAARAIGELACWELPRASDDDDLAAYRLKADLMDEVGPPTRRAVWEQVRAVDVALRKVIHEQLTSGLRVRAWGIGLISAGIFLSTAAGVWATGAS